MLACRQPAVGQLQLKRIAHGVNHAGKHSLGVGIARAAPPPEPEGLIPEVPEDLG